MLKKTLFCLSISCVMLDGGVASAQYSGAVDEFSHRIRRPEIQLQAPAVQGNLGNKHFTLHATTATPVEELSVDKSLFSMGASVNTLQPSIQKEAPKPSVPSTAPTEIAAKIDYESIEKQYAQAGITAPAQLSSERPVAGGAPAIALGPLAQEHHHELHPFYNDRGELMGSWAPCECGTAMPSAACTQRRTVGVYAQPAPTQTCGAPIVPAGYYAAPPRGLFPQADQATFVSPRAR